MIVSISSISLNMLGSETLRDCFDSVSMLQPQELVITSGFWPRAVSRSPAALLPCLTQTSVTSGAMQSINYGTTTNGATIGNMHSTWLRSIC